MKNRMLQLAGAMALVMVVGKFYAVPALAETVKAVLVKNVDERGRIPFSAESTCSSSTGFCVMSFPAVPANKRLVVEFVHISASSYNYPLLALAMNTQTSGPGYYKLTMAPTQINSIAGSNRYIVNQNLVNYFDSTGPAPSLRIDAAESTSVGAVGIITGYLVDLTQ